MKKSYVLEQTQWDELWRISRRMAEVDVEARRAMDEYKGNAQVEGAREKWILALGICAAVCEVHGERLRELMGQVMTVYDLEQSIVGYNECLKGPHMYPTGPDQEDPGYCPGCMPDDAGAEADRRGDERRDAEAERSMEK